MCRDSKKRISINSKIKFSYDDMDNWSGLEGLLQIFGEFYFPLTCPFSCFSGLQEAFYIEGDDCLDRRKSS